MADENEKTEELAKERTKFSQERTKFSQERTHFSNERTLLSYLRTALAFFALGAFLGKFFESKFTLVLTILAIIVGIILLLYGIWKFFKYKGEIDQNFSDEE